MNIEIRVDTVPFRDWLARAARELETSAKQSHGQSAAMAVETARSTTLFKDRTGALRSSIQRKQLGPWGWKIVATAKHAAYVEGGTKPHPIVAVRARALRFYWHGRLTFRKRVQHPGTKPTHFLQRSTEWAGDALAEMLARAAERSFR